MSNSEKYQIKTLIKALEFLIAFGKSRKPLSLSEIKNRYKINQTTLYRYLYTFESLDFIRKDENDRYYLGPSIYNLWDAALDLYSIRNVAHPFLIDLGKKINETINLGILEDNRIRYIDIIESQHNLIMKAEIGSMGYLHSTAMGKSILAYSAKEFIDKYFEEKIPKFTPNTITTKRAFLIEIKHIKDQGCSMDIEENEIGVICIASPIIIDQPTIKVKGAISISIPSIRFQTYQKATLVNELNETAKNIIDEFKKIHQLI